MMSELDEVTRLFAEYAYRIDSGDAEGWSELFAADGELRNAEMVIRGRPSLAKFAQRAYKGVHLLGAPSLRQGPDGSLRSVSNWLFVPSGSVAMMGGVYRDEFVRTDAELVFALRVVEHLLPAAAAAAGSE
jgi:hypothetical protein